jgi:CheY-like chemotaxis protein
LAVDDDPVNQRLLQRLLEKRGHEVVLAPDARAALTLYECNRFDVVLMDVEMPEIDGLEATRRIRSREKDLGLLRVPIIALTAHTSSEARQNCLEAGCDAYLTKPIQPSDLYELLERVTAVKTVPDLQTTDRPETTFGFTAGQMPIIDAQKALAKLHGDRALYAELVQLFLEDCRVLQAKLREAISSKNALLLRQTAHTLKGAAGSIGAEPIANAARQVEHLVVTDQIHEAFTRAARLTELLEQVPAAVAALSVQAES